MASPGEILTYTVMNETNVPALTSIRIQISNINNPPTPSGSLTVSITTRNPSNGIIDGPTPTSAYDLVQVGNAQIAPGAVTTTKIASGAVTTGDIANGAVTGSKIQGTQKLLFGECELLADGSTLPAGESAFVTCPVPGTEFDDDILALYIERNKFAFTPGLSVDGGAGAPDLVDLFLRNDSPVSVTLENQVFSILVFKK